MTKATPDPTFEILLKKAEAFLNGETREALTSDDQDFLKLLHEAEVQRIELDVQNEELRRTIRSLENANRDFAALYDLVQAAIFLVSKNGLIEGCNRAATEMFADTCEGLLGMNFSDLISSEDHGVYFDYLKDLRSNGTDAPCRIRVAGAGNRVIFVQLQAEAVSRTGRELAWQFALFDITGARQREERPKQSESFYRELVRNVNSAVIHWNVDGTITFFNEYAQSFFGWSAEEAIGKHVGVLVPEQESTGADLTSLVRDIVAQPEKYVTNVNENVCRDGRRVWMTWTNKPIRDAQGRVTAILAVGSDITGLKQAERAVAESEHLLQDVMDNMVAMIGLMTPDGTLIRANRTALEAADLRPEDVLGKPFEECFWWAWSPEVQKRLRSAIDEAAAGRLSRYDEVIRVGDDAFRAIDFMLAPMVGPDGRIVYLIPSATDISDRKAAEAQTESIAKFPEENPNPVMRIDVEGRLLYVNRAAQQLLDRCGTHPGKTLLTEFVQIASRILHQGTAEDVEVNCGASTYLFSFTPVAEGAYINLYGKDITARKQAEEALLQSELFHRQVLESIPGMIFTTRPDGYCDFQSLQWEEYTGVQVTEHLGDGWNRLLHPDDRPRAFSAWRQAVEQNEPYDLEYRVRRYDGVYEWFRVIGRKIHDSRGNVIRWFGVVMNIEQLKQSQEALRRSEERWNAAIDKFDVGAIIATESEHVIYWNPAATAMHGFTNDQEGIGLLHEKQDTFELWTLDGSRMLAIDEWPMRRIKRGESVRNLELRLRRPGQKWEKIVSYSGSMVETPSGERLIFLSVHDLTQQRKAEMALRESEKMYRTIGEAIEYGIWVTDAAGQCTYVSQSFLELVNMSLDKIQQFGWLHLLPAEDVEPTREHWLHCVETGEEFNREHRFRSADGSFRHVLALGRPVRDAQGNITSWVGLNLDITERKKMEEALRESNQDLSEFSYALTHNVKAPFRAIQNYANFLLEDLADTLGGEPRRFLDGIGKAIRLANHQFEDLEALYRVKDHPLEFETLDMCELLAEITALHDGKPDRELVIEAQWPTLWGEHFLLRQTLMALVENGFKYNQSDIKRVEVTWRRASDGRFEIVVRDNGIGIDPQHHKHIFLIFKRLHTEDEYEGTGIGLAIIRKSVQKIGGKLRIESAVGQGSTFVIRLPAAMVESAAEHNH